MKIKLNSVGVVEVSELNEKVNKFRNDHPRGNVDIDFHFDSEDERLNFLSKFPKYIGFKEQYIGEETVLNLTMLPLNKNTGEINESFINKMKKLTSILSK